jgi:elongation factor Ts
MVTAMAHPVTIDAVKALRETTDAPVGDVKRALETAARTCRAPSYGAGACECEEAALQELRARGAQMAQRRAGRAVAQGRVETYLHHDGRIAALVEINCETDFVARTPEFQQFCRDVAMQVAAMGSAGLLAQPFIKDQGSTVGDLLKALIAKTGENVVIRRSARFAVGETLEGGP